MTTSTDLHPTAEGLDREMDGAADDGYDEEDEEFPTAYSSHSGSETPSEEAARDDPSIPQWNTISDHPGDIPAAIREVFELLSRRERNRLSIMVVGRSSVGKSHTTNSLFAAQVVQVVPFHMVSYTNTQPVVIRKKIQGTEFTIIDTPGLVESDGLSKANLQRVAFTTKNNPVDIVMYVDRLDMKIDDLDLQVFEGLNDTFGPDVWKRVMVGLTRANMRAPPPGSTYEQAVEKRIAEIRKGMRSAGAGNASLPCALIENSVRCRTNDSGEKVLPNGQSWVPALFRTAAQLSLANSRSGLLFDPAGAFRARDMVRKLVFIPLALLGQFLFKAIVLDPLIEDDGTKGDRYGPFDPVTRELEKEKLMERKEREKRERSEAKLRAAKLKAKIKQGIEPTVGSDSSSDEDVDDFWDDE